MPRGRAAEQSHPAAYVTQRSYNERLVLSLLRRHNALPKADLARLTGLSPTAIGTIIMHLEAARLVRRGEPQRGRVGQPSVPYTIDPHGAFALGLKIGRRSAELVMLDAALQTIALAETAYPYPTPEGIERFATVEARRMLRGSDRSRWTGLGIAMPSEIWCWGEEMDAPRDQLLAWQDYDFAAGLGQMLGTPVTIANDATAACAAQLAVCPELGTEEGRPAGALNFIYFFVGWFIGGGVVLGGRVLEGSRGNAGAIGSMPICPARRLRSKGPQQLIRTASLYTLERALRSDGIDPDILWQKDVDWLRLGAAPRNWLDSAAAGVAQAVAAAAAVVDFDAAVIDGTFPSDMRERFAKRVERYYGELDRQGLSPILIRAGTVGRYARAIGAACLPMLSAFAVDEAALPVRYVA
jgi:predicted NBD/HSP70 family sugar kinase